MSVDLLEKKPLIEEYLRMGWSRLSSLSFPGIFTWRDFFRFDVELMDGNLCVFAGNEVGTFLYWPPLGERVSPDVVERCFAVMEKKNRGSGVSRIENVGGDLLPLFPEPGFRRYQKAPEYCYYKKDIADLKGTRYKSKRSSYNQFIRNNAPRYRPFEASMLEECLALYDAWAKERGEAHPDDAIYLEMLKENRSVHRAAIAHERELGLIGRVVEIDGEIRAYTFGYEIIPAVFCVFLEIADHACPGLGVYIFREFCRDRSLVRYQFINVMDDFALKNIEQTKMSFHPSVLLSSYVISRPS